MPCPNCGSPLRMVEPTMSPKKGVDYEYTSAKCLGVIERQGLAKKKNGTMAWRIKYKSKPCGWSYGPQRTTKQVWVAKEPVRDETAPVKGTQSPTGGRLVLNDYR